MTGDKETSDTPVEETTAEPAKAADETVAETASGAPAGEEEASPEALEKRLTEAERKASEYWDAVLRGRAELENLRKRSERDLENAHKYGLERFVSELLPVKDSLELGLSAGAGGDPGQEKMREGMELTLKMFSTALEKFGVTEVDPEGQVFDPEFHQAMTMQESQDQESNTVVTVVQKGYLLNDRLVRPALVIVAK